MPDELPEALQSALAERYDIRRVLGRGGMATVHLAYDRKRRREVALTLGALADRLATLAAELIAEQPAFDPPPRRLLPCLGHSRHPQPHRFSSRDQRLKAARRS